MRLMLARTWMGYGTHAGWDMGWVMRLMLARTWMGYGTDAG